MKPKPILELHKYLASYTDKQLLDSNDSDLYLALKSQEIENKNV